MTVEGTISQETVDAVLARLGADVDGARVITEEPGLGRAAQVWNAEVDHHPAVVVRCRSTAEVSAAVRAATGAGLPLSVRGGGHDHAGRAVVDGGLVVDLRGMNRVEVTGGTVRLGGGTTCQEVADAVEPHGEVVVTGSVGQVGHVGLSLGGGYGPLTAALGMACDAVVAAEVVLADGSVVTADADHHGDLLWALRGGGGNFGVVTALEVLGHEARPLVGGAITYPWDQAREVLLGLGDLHGALPDELTVQFGIMAGPDGSPVTYLLPSWFGAAEQADAAISPLLALGEPVAVDVGPRTQPELLHQSDFLGQPGTSWDFETRTLASLTPPAVDALLRAAEAPGFAGNLLNVHDFHGVPGRTPAGSTAFARREDHLVVQIIAGWSDGAAQENTAWARETSAALAPHALPGGYVNLLGPDRQDQVDEEYGDHASRLHRVKTTYDPAGVFTATTLPRW